MSFKELDYENWERKKLFEFFTQEKPSFVTITENICCTKFYKTVKKYGFKIYPCLIYILGKAVNKFDCFKLCYKDGKLGYADCLHPSFSHLYPNADVFTNIASLYQEDFLGFYKTILNDIESNKNLRGFEYFESEHFENYYGVTTLPQINFTSFSAQENNLDYKSNFAPFFCIGKINKNRFQMQFPLSIRCNHAVADGYHISLLFNEIQKEINSFPQTLKRIRHEEK